MPINEFGEFVRETPAPEKELPPALRLATMLEGMLISNNSQAEVEIPEGVKYYKPERADAVRSGLREFKEIAEREGIERIVNFDSSEGPRVEDVVKEIEANLVYSESVNTSLGSNSPEETDA